MDKNTRLVVIILLVFLLIFKGLEGRLRGVISRLEEIDKEDDDQDRDK